MKTLKHLSLSVLSLALMVVVMSGCKKDKDDNNANRNVKYELSGTYTGKFSILITDTQSGSQTYSDVSIPWSKEVSYPGNVIAIGIGATPTTDGAPGQTVLLKIYSGGNVVKTSNGTVDNNGYLILPALSHGF